jgi:hypothetical protein
VKVGDMVKYAAPGCDSIGVIVAKLPADHIVAASVSVLWCSGEHVKRVPPRILEVISESR